MEACGIMKTLTIDCRMIRASGIGTYLRSILDHLLQVPDLDLCLLVDPNQPPLAPPPNVSRIPLAAPIYGLKEQLLLPLRVPRCDLFWSPHFNVPFAPLRARHRVVTIHDLCHLDCPEHVAFLHRAYARVLLNAAARSADVILTDSNFSRERILAHLNVASEKIRVTPLGVDTARFARVTDPERRRAAATRLGLPEHFILFVGNVKPHKNIRGLLDAWQRLEKEFPDHRLVITGRKDKFITGISNLAESVDHRNLTDRVLFTGFVPDELLPDLYSLASCLAFPSFYEGFGLPPLEAMACGCPAVVSRAASLPEACGDAACYVDPYDAASIADGIRQVLTNPSVQKELVEKGYQRVKQLTWQQTAQQCLQIFQEIF